VIFRGAPELQTEEFSPAFLPTLLLFQPIDLFFFCLLILQILTRLLPNLFLPFFCVVSGFVCFDLFSWSRVLFVQNGNMFYVSLDSKSWADNLAELFFCINSPIGILNGELSQINKLPLFTKWKSPNFILYRRQGISSDFFLQP